MKYWEIVLGSIGGIYAIYTGINWKTASGVAKFFSIVGIVAAFIVGYNSYSEIQNSEREKEINAEAGKLTNVKEPNYPGVMIGNNGAVLVLKEGTFSPSASLPKIFSAEIVDGKYLFSSVIRDTNGKPIAVIEKNEWTKYPPPGYEYNNNNSAFEIVTEGDRRVYFQVELNGGIAHFQGFTISESKKGFYWSDTTSGAIATPFIKGTPFVFPTLVKRLFRYPRSMHIGERESN